MNKEELFTELKNKKNKSDIAINLIKEINEKIENKTLTFTEHDSDEIYLYMFLCNKYEISDTLDKLINEVSFIELLDKTKIEGSILPSLTDVCQKPRKCLLKNSKKLKNSIIKGDPLLSTEDILADLTKEEIYILREDIEIDNYLISNGLSFSTLNKETIKRLLSEVELFNIYEIATINEFANNYNKIEELANNDSFVTIYIDKLDDDYHYFNKLFKHFSLEQVQNILKTKPNKNVLLHLVKDAEKNIQSYLLQTKEIFDTIKENANEDILMKLPKETLYKIFANKRNIFKGINLNILEKFSKKDLERLFNDNKTMYKEFLSSLNTFTEDTLLLLVNSLPKNLLEDFTTNSLADLNIKTLTELLKTGNKTIRNAIINNAEICTNLINKTTTRTLKSLKELIKIGKYTNDEVATLIKNTANITNHKILDELINFINPATEEEKQIEIPKKEEKIELDDTKINSLINNLEELKTQSTKVIVSIINKTDSIVAEKILKEESVLEKIFNDKKTSASIIDLASTKKILLPIFTNQKTIKYYTKENIEQLLKHLDINEKNRICTNDVLRKLVNNNEAAYDIYKKLYNKNKYILNTINFDFLCLPELDKIKLSILELITKYPIIQDNIVRINKRFKIVPNFLNNLLYSCEELDFTTTLSDILNVFRESTEGINRKIIGNIPKMINELNEEMSKDNMNKLISYILYQIPRYYNKDILVKRPIVLTTPSTIEELLSYEHNTEQQLDNIISTCQEEEIKEYFVQRHFKLSLEEAHIMLNMYSIERLDNTIYQEEYTFLNNLNRIVNTLPEHLREMNQMYETISIMDSFIIEKNIKEMYGKIFNYEIRSKTYSNAPFTKKIYGKELTIYSCPNDFMFLISNINIDNEFAKNNSYFESWHNTLNNLENGVNTSLIANDNFIVKEEFVFGFNGLLDQGINKMSNYKVCPNCKNTIKEKYMTPRELIDNTRDENNTIVIDRYAVRPNYNNSNIPNIEPDFILADIKKLEDNSYLEKISRASEEFKTKRNRNGLPIIAYDIEKIINNEISKIKTLINKYNKNHDMNLLVSILTKIENNYTAYRTYNNEYANNFLIENIIKIILERINVTNSIAELEFIEELFTRENNKFDNLTKELNCNYDLKELKVRIKQRKNILSI